MRVEWESDGRVVRFRFFDPAVLRVWLLSCNGPELAAFFGPITHIFAEDWCEEPGLSKAHNIFHFAKADDASPMTVHRIDMRTLEPTMIEPFAVASQARAQRSTGPLTLIRRGHEAAFEQMQMEIFCEMVAQELAKIGEAEGYGKADITKARAFVRTHIARAQDYDLTTEYDLMGFVFCAWRLGERFDTEHTEFTPALADKNEAELTALFEKYVYNADEGKI